MNKGIQNTLVVAVAAVMAGLATVALPLLNHAMNPDLRKKDKPRIVAQVGIKTLETTRKELKPKRNLREPKRSRPAPTLLKSGPRFAMDLSVAGSGGAAAPLELVNKKSGGSGRQNSGDDQGVDERPAPTMPPSFRMPPEVKSREKDAFLSLSFCVDVSGRPYDIRIAEEKPPGLGMAAAGREALQQTRFTPAKKNGLSVPFCGLEQPFEVRFSN